MSFLPSLAKVIRGRVKNRWRSTLTTWLSTRFDSYLEFKVLKINGIKKYLVDFQRGRLLRNFW